MTPLLTSEQLAAIDKRFDQYDGRRRIIERFGLGEAQYDELRASWRERRAPVGEVPIAESPPTTDGWTLPKVAKSVPVVPAFAQPVFEVKTFGIGGNWKRFLVGFDIHGDKADADAVETFFNFGENIWKPQIKVCGGDVWDFRPYRKGASSEERYEDIRADYVAGQTFLERLFAGEGENYFTRGNHDERLWEMRCATEGVHRQYAQEKVAFIEDEMKRMRVQMLPYHKLKGLLQLGHLKILHGFYCGVNAARQTALSYGAAIFGHTHVIDQHAVPGLERRSARNCGALCTLDMEYNARMPNTLRQANGFAYGVLNSQTGDYHVWQAERINESWLLASDIVEL